MEGMTRRYWHRRHDPVSEKRKVHHNEESATSTYQGKNDTVETAAFRRQARPTREVTLNGEGKTERDQ